MQSWLCDISIINSKLLTLPFSLFQLCWIQVTNSVIGSNIHSCYLISASASLLHSHYGIFIAILLFSSLIKFTSRLGKSSCLPFRWHSPYSMTYCAQHLIVEFLAFLLQITQLFVFLRIVYTVNQSKHSNVNHTSFPGIFPIYILAYSSSSIYAIFQVGFKISQLHAFANIQCFWMPLFFTSRLLYIK